MAFQIQDDILDVTSTIEVLGKAINSDKKNQKTTYVTLKSLKEAKEEVKELSNQAIIKLQSLGKETSFIEELLMYLIYRKY
jgi:geranylgeranyl diphosphate synthase type II